ncbi:MAG: flagellar biosynthetic protein FliO [Bradyrhizobiaceae bacterium]|nr:flagellar biosynthetic protein FliO [Bradyrhizobiaceae bacterium]
MGFFEQIFGTELGLPARAVVALVLVLALIALTVWLMRRFGEGRIATGAGGRGRQQRLAVLDSAVVDARRRLVLIRRDNVEHLILIGGPTDVVVEPNIVRAQPLGGAARPGARPGGFEDESETTLIPEPEAEAPRPPAPAPRTPEPRQVPRPAPQRVDPQYADMAQRLEAALRKPVTEPELPRPASAPAPRAPEPRIETRPAPAPRPAPTVIQPAPRAPEPRVVEPRVAEAPRPAPAPAPAQQPAPAAKQESAADIFGSLEEEMASLLRPGKKESK